MSIYEKLGLQPIINAAGTLTRLGGTVMRPEVRDAMTEAANELIPVDELQAVASSVIAHKCGSEAGFVTSGAAAGLTLAAAACMTGLDVARMDQLPHPEGGRTEIIICRPHRNSYDHAYRAAGATFREVGMSDRYVGVGVRETEVWEIEAAINERTAAIAYTAGANAHPPLRALTEMASRHGVPGIVDAAGQLPPPSNLWRYIADGADLVVFSGGKAIRGPQGTGILAGRRDLISSVALQSLDMDVTFDLWSPPPELITKIKLVGAPRHGVGRGYKVAKEQIVGLIVALEMFTEEQCTKDYEDWMTHLQYIEDGLRGCANVRTALIPPRLELGVPQLELDLRNAILGRTSFDVAAALRCGQPPIYVGERKVMDGYIMINPVNLDAVSTTTVLRRLQEALQ